MRAAYSVTLTQKGTSHTTDKANTTQTATVKYTDNTISTKLAGYETKAEVNVKPTGTRRTDRGTMDVVILSNSRVCKKYIDWYLLRDK